jgi:hypothetical protein
MTNQEKILELRKEIKKIYSPSVRFIMNNLITCAFLGDVDSVKDAIDSIHELAEIYGTDKDKVITSYKAHQMMVDSRYILEKVKLFKDLYTSYLNEDETFKVEHKESALKIIELLDSLR